MVKPTDELTLECTAENISAMSDSKEYLGRVHLDDLLTIANSSAVRETAEGTLPEKLPATLRENSTNDWSPVAPLAGVIIGKLVGVNPQGVAEVDFPGNTLSKPLCARTAISLDNTCNNQEVVLMFENGDFKKPIILGAIQAPGDVSRKVGGQEALGATVAVSDQIDEERITITANNELVLKCGKASITLTKAGKIIIRGAYLLSRSSGVNRIKGGSVQIN